MRCAISKNTQTAQGTSISPTDHESTDAGRSRKVLHVAIPLESGGNSWDPSSQLEGDQAAGEPTPRSGLT